MNHNTAYTLLSDELAKVSTAWYQTHQAALQAQAESRERLLFEEQRLEKKMQQLIDGYNYQLAYRVHKRPVH